VEISELVAQLRADGNRITIVIAAADPAASVPTCPGWTMRDLVRHLGGVHRWATGFVRGDGRQPKGGDLERLVGGWPDDVELPSWFEAGHRDLLEALRSAPTDLETWTFLDAPSPLAFWARRQAHETAIHRVDAEAAIGDVTVFPAPFAADGIDELLLRFVARGGPELPTDRERTVLVEAIDVDRRWHITSSPTGLTTSTGRGAPRAETTIRGPASDLYVGLWNRGSFEGSEVDGDDRSLEFWREHVRIRWS
jgi:uncharacterized protein (TIGR03083 family)